MIQIIGLLLCAYLVFKGYEILQIGLASSRDDRRAVVTWGVVWFIASIGVAVGFAVWMVMEGEALRDQSNRPLPPFR